MSEPLAVWVWSPDDGDEADGRSVANDGDCCYLAAKYFAERRYVDAEYPETQVIHVRDSAGNVRKFSVRTENEPTFYASEF